MPNKIDFFPCVCGARVRGSAYSSRTMCLRPECSHHDELRNLLNSEIAEKQKLRHHIELVRSENDPTVQRDMIQDAINRTANREVRQYLWNWLHLY